MTLPALRYVIPTARSIIAMASLPVRSLEAVTNACRMAAESSISSGETPQMREIISNNGLSINPGYLKVSLPPYFAFMLRKQKVSENHGAFCSHSPDR